MHPVEPHGRQLAAYDILEAKYAASEADVVVMGDSRANQWGVRWLKDGGFSDPVNLAVSLFTVENWLWQLANTHVDLSRSHVALLEVGIGSERYADDTANEIASGITHGIRQLTRKMADGAHVYLLDVYDARPGSPNYDQAHNDALNDRLAGRAGATGDFVFVDVDLDFSTDYADNTHLNAAGNAKVEAALIEAMVDHGDMAGALAMFGAPHQPPQVVGLSGFDPLMI
jgi:hypothetical protein